jgi:hypothetical protein
MSTLENDIFTIEDQHASLPHIGTTLYEIVKAVSDEVLPDEDGLVTDVVMQMIDDCTGRFFGEQLNGCIKFG